MQAFGNFKRSLNPFLRGSLYYAFFWGAAGVYMPFLFIYFAQLGISSEQIGILSSIFSLCVLVVSPLVSRLADRTNQRTGVLALCLAGYALMLIALPAAREFFPLALMFLVMSIFNAPIGPLADSLVVRMAISRQLNFGGMRLRGSFIYSITAVIFGLVWQQAGYEYTFLLGGGLMLLVSASALLLEDTPPLAPDVLAPEIRAEMNAPVSLWKDARFMLLLAALFLLGAAFSMAWTFESIYVTQLGGSRALIGGMRGLSALSEILPMQFSQRILRKFGDFKTLVLAFLLLALSNFGYWAASGTLTILLVNVIKGLGFGLFFI